jgi:hypothetical protein
MYKRILHITFFLLSSFAFAQNKKVSLPELAMEYEIPAKWEVKSFFKGDWEVPGGNNVCQCAGVMNSLKVPSGGDFEYLYFAVYPSDRKGANAEKRQSVWQYFFVPKESSDTLKTDYLVWEKQVSKLKPHGSNDNRFKDYIAWRLLSKFGNTYYTMYIWAKPMMMQQYSSTFQSMIESFKPVK